MNNKKRILSIAMVAVLAFAVVFYRHWAPPSGPAAGMTTVSGGRPTFIEIGAKSCIPCQMMQKVMDELRMNYPGKLDIVFHDLEIDHTPAQQYGISVIPTQVLLSPEGEELSRHEGFYPVDEIAAKWRELGYDLGESSGLAQGGFLDGIFSTLTKAVEGSAWLALAASFVWGILSILLSPCHLASIPLIVGFIEKQGKTGVARAFGISTLFSVGILLTIALIGMVTAALGRMAGDVGAAGNYFVAAVFLAVGLYLFGAIQISLPGAAAVNMARRGMLAAFVLGLVFGIALGPCTFAYMAPVLGMVFKTGSENLLYAASLLLAYGFGHCSVIVLAGGSTEYVQRYLNWSTEAKGTDILKKVCGILVVAGGLWLLWTA
jgi:Thiol:disulfide interchange protein